MEKVRAQHQVAAATHQVVIDDRKRANEESCSSSDDISGPSQWHVGPDPSPRLSQDDWELAPLQQPLSVSQSASNKMTYAAGTAIRNHR